MIEWLTVRTDEEEDAKQDELIKISVLLNIHKSRR